MTTELTRIERGGIVQQDRPSDDPQSLIALAIEKGVPLGDLVAMRREWRAEKAKEAFDAAMAAFQTECPVIYKTKAGGQTKCGDVAYKYAAFEDILAQVKPLLQKHGFSFQLGTDVESKDGWVIARCKVTHSHGHCDTTEAKFPLGTKTGVMSDTQVYAAALSFASRRAFQNAFGIITAGEDMDGRIKPTTEGPSKTATLESLKAELWAVLKPIRGAEKNWDAAYKWLVGTGILKEGERVNNMPAEQLTAIIDSARVQLEREG